MPMTIERLKQMVTYNPETGEFRRLTTKSGCRGQRVGWTEPDGRKRVLLDGERFWLHRLAWLYVHGSCPPIIDHINGDPSDNRISNLREATPQQNIQNKAGHANSRLKTKGVTLTPDGRFRAQIRVGPKRIHLGYFSALEAAAKAYEEAARTHFGEFATTRRPRSNPGERKEQSGTT